jgi:hypothetical protein
MADLQNFSVTRKLAANINTQTHEITGQVIEGGQMIADYTSGNALQWPGVLNELSPEQQDTIVQELAQTVILLKAGLL